jgi:hypothetical protein
VCGLNVEWQVANMVGTVSKMSQVNQMLRRDKRKVGGQGGSG